jgi:hypothetical protein
MARLYGRAPQGARVVGTVPQNDGDHSTLLGALDQQGIQAVMTVHGATAADVLRAAVRQVLGPTLVPGDIVGLENLSAHQAVALLASVLARPLTHGTLRAPAENRLAGGQGAYPRRFGDRDSRGDENGHGPQCMPLVPAWRVCLIMK